jgi:hypothetical protein
MRDEGFLRREVQLQFLLQEEAKLLFTGLCF